MKGYLATHFFHEAGFNWTKMLAERIRKETGIELYVPQENGEINDKTDVDNKVTDVDIFDADTNQLTSSNFLICCLDGVEIDSGVACEIGYFAALAKEQDIPRKIIGILTDMRQDSKEPPHALYRNLYVTGCCRKYGTIVRSLDELVSEINKEVDNNWRN
jgi:nucleoside 2-deoxyribosyltransferase